MLYIKYPQNLLQAKPKTKPKTPKQPDNGIDWKGFVGRRIKIYTTSQIAYDGILLNNLPGCVVLVLQFGDFRNRPTIQAAVRKSDVVAVAYRFVSLHKRDWNARG